MYAVKLHPFGFSDFLPEPTSFKTSAKQIGLTGVDSSADDDLRTQEKSGKKQDSRQEESHVFAGDHFILHTKTHVQLSLDIPGVSKSDVDVTAEEDGLVKVSGCRKVTGMNGEVIKKAKFSRSFQLDYETTELSKLKANLTDGVLTLTAPKKVKAQPRKIPIWTKSDEADKGKKDEGNASGEDKDDANKKKQ